jgi:multiple sugar transport system ATP-binding protein
MPRVTFDGVGKVYPDGTRAVAGLDLELADGELMVLVGPSGCGKSTTLRMTAGLEEITEGEIRIGDQVVNTVDPRERDVAMVFQNYALYPHMSVFDNLSFPLRARGLPRTEVRDRVQRTAELLGIKSLLRRRPRTLSGGQRQRVAMGRALVREPQVFLLDEPLSNLDAKLRTQMRSEIARLQRDLGVTTIYVTHDQVEAMTMGTRIAVMRDGVLQQQGPPQQLYDEPENLFVAAFVGSPAMNLLEARLELDGDSLQCIVGDHRLPVATRNGNAEALASYAGREVAVGIRPEHLGDPAGAPPGRPTFRGRVRFVELLGAERLVQVEIDARPVVADEVLEVAGDADTVAASEILRDAERGRALVSARFEAHAAVGPGDLAEVSIRTDRLAFFDLETGRAIRG